MDDWLALPEDEPGELVDGRLEEEEVPDYVHELLVALLIHVYLPGSPRPPRRGPDVVVEAGILEDVPGCEGLLLDLDALWARVDELEA